MCRSPFLLGGGAMDPRELTLIVTGIANSLYGAICKEELSVLAAAFVQLGDTLATMLAQSDYIEACCACKEQG